MLDEAKRNGAQPVDASTAEPESPLAKTRRRSAPSSSSPCPPRSCEQEAEFNRRLQNVEWLQDQGFVRPQEAELQGAWPEASDSGT